MARAQSPRLAAHRASSSRRRSTTIPPVKVPPDKAPTARSTRSTRNRQNIEPPNAQAGPSRLSAAPESEHATVSRTRRESVVRDDGEGSTQRRPKRESKRSLKWASRLRSESRASSPEAHASTFKSKPKKTQGELEILLPAYKKNPNPTKKEKERLGKLLKMCDSLPMYYLILC